MGRKEIEFFYKNNLKRFLFDNVKAKTHSAKMIYLLYSFNSLIEFLLVGCLL